MSESFSKVLRDELRNVDERRKQLNLEAATLQVDEARSAQDQALARNLTGMGISGGGIRTATFNLGILQGLAEHGLLPQLDYLSTVSGGGYIGSWLHGVIRRMHHGYPGPAQDELAPSTNPVPGAPADDPVSFLRKYSNYLAPRFSLFSTDVWAIAAIWVRNMFLNWCVLVPFLAAVLLLPVVGGLVHQELDTPANHELLLFLSYLPALALLISAVLIMSARLNDVARRTFEEEKPEPEPNPGSEAKSGRRKPDAGWCATLVFFATVLMGATATDPRNWYWWALAIGGAGLWGLFLILQVKGGFVTCYRKQHESAGGAVPLTLVFSLFCAAVTAVLLFVLLVWMSGWQAEAKHWTILAVGPPLVTIVLSIGVSLLLGLMGVDYPDAAREWVSRLGALLGIWLAAWMAIFALGVYSPFWIALLFATWGKTAIAGVGSWAATSAAGIFSANSGKTKGAGAPGGSSNQVLEVVAKLGPTVFMAGFLILISCGLHWGIRNLTGRNNLPAAPPAVQQLSLKLESADGSGVAVSANRTGQIQVSVPPQGVHKFDLETKSTGAPLWTSRVMGNHWDALKPQGQLTPTIAGAMVALFLLTLLFSARININEFSMHHFYKNRLVRCYLGASKGHARQPNSWTGFDPQDDIPLKNLHAFNRYYGPYPIVNTAVNLNRGSELAKQERKAGSFVFTPRYCGFTPERSDEDIRRVREQAELQEHGYCLTEGFGGKGGPHLGSAMAISGAAANPNMGYHTSAPVAFLLTVFNVRLGWWVGNPRRVKASARRGPRSSIFCLINELTGQTDDRSSYLNLSDGGHFDNLGLYELVRRRCRFIIIGDGEQDPDLTFGSLASAIRKCQTDFGVTIDIDMQSVRETNGLSHAHCVIGTIAYPEKDPIEAEHSEYGMGLLLYFKASLTGDEPEDVQEYRSRFAEFPHQSTADQFFTESQFESYRVLGLHIARIALQEIGTGRPVREIFRQLRRSWSPPPAIADGVATRLSAAYSALLNQLKSDSDLRYLDNEIVPGLPAFTGTPTDSALRKGYLYCLDCIRLAESVYVDLQFRDLKQRENRSNQGWITILRYWAAQPHIRQVWRTVHVTLNPLFRHYFQELMEEV
jgi:hypothetical protein